MKYGCVNDRVCMCCMLSRVRMVYAQVGFSTGVCVRLYIDTIGNVIMDLLLV